MDNFAQFLEGFISRDREAEKQKEQNYIELIQMIKAELMLIHENGECAELEELD
ncbi:MAG: hypothetical protein ABSG38_02120 [Spirochaetia bacterium]|jgi:hypothetical protein